MTTDTASIVVLASEVHELEAAAMAAALEDHGVKPRIVGDYTSGFRAKTPGGCQILVMQSDLARAQQVLDALPSEGSSIDWTDIDVGDDSAPADDEEVSDAQMRPNKIQATSKVVYHFLRLLFGIA